MSKERDLLKKIIKHMKYLYYECNKDLRDEIQELLAQPDQSNEPVAWFYERQIEGFTERTMSVGFEENFDGIIIPLYTSLTTRKPLSDKPIQDYLESYNQEISYDYEQGFEDGVEWAEQQHGIGVGDE